MEEKWTYTKGHLEFKPWQIKGYVRSHSVQLSKQVQERQIAGRATLVNIIKDWG